MSEEVEEVASNLVHESAKFSEKNMDKDPLSEVLGLDNNNSKIVSKVGTRSMTSTSITTPRVSHVTHSEVQDTPKKLSKQQHQQQVLEKQNRKVNEAQPTAKENGHSQASKKAPVPR